MRLIILFSAGIFACSQSFAVVDPDQDQIGLYFDHEANITCINVQPEGYFSVYVIVTNPTSEVFEGVELSVCTEVTGGDPDGLIFNGSAWPGNCPPGFFYIDQFCEEGRTIVCPAPVDLEGQTHYVCELSYLMLEELEVSFFLGPDSIDVDGDGLPAYFNSYGRVPLGISSGGADLPVAKVNGECGVVSGDQHSFGKLKSLFR